MYALHIGYTVCTIIFELDIANDFSELHINVIMCHGENVTKIVSEFILFIVTLMKLWCVTATCIAFEYYL